MIDALMEEGVEPSAIVKGLGFDPAGCALSLDKYSPDQPRVPAGSGRASGQWTSGNWTAEVADNTIAQAESASPTGARPTSARVSEAGVRPDLTAAQAESANGQLVLGPDQWDRADIQEFMALVNDPTVKMSIEAAWKDSTADPQHPHEMGFFILRDPQTGTISLQWAAPGFAGRLTMNAQPPSAIASFHTHPNPTGSPVILNGKPFVENGEPQVWSPGPSAADLDAATRWGLPGIVESDQGLFFYGPNLRP
jgi:hypothetical protein